jgi:hypothetical protein
MTDTSTEFDWSVRNPEVIVRSQPAIAVYTNTADQVVLVREREWNEEEDAFVLISREHAIKVAHAILEAAGQGDIEFIRPCGAGYQDVPIQPAVAAMMATTPDIDWKAANEDFDGIEAEVSEPKPKDKTAAERQRRYRNKHRNGNGRDVTGEGVTVTNGHALPPLEYKELAG